LSCVCLIKAENPVLFMQSMNTMRRLFGSMLVTSMHSVIGFSFLLLIFNRLIQMLSFLVHCTIYSVLYI